MESERVAPVPESLLIEAAQQMERDGHTLLPRRLRAALAAQPAQAGEAVAWAIKDVHGDFINACVYKSERAAKNDIWHFDGGGSAELAPGAPHTAVPLYAAPSRPGGA